MITHVGMPLRVTLVCHHYLQCDGNCAAVDTSSYLYITALEMSSSAHTHMHTYITALQMLSSAHTHMHTYITALQMLSSAHTRMHAYMHKVFNKCEDILCIDNRIANHDKHTDGWTQWEDQGMTNTQMDGHSNVVGC